MQSRDAKTEEKLLWGLAILVLMVTLWGCKDQKAPPPRRGADATKKATSRPTSRPAQRREAAKWDKARAKDAWIEQRVTVAKNRLSTTPAGKLIWATIEASGGLKRWYQNGPIAFRFTYKPVGKKRARDTRQVVDTWASRAYHIHAATPSMRFGWDGKQAWRLPKGKKQPIAVRFWSLTPYYFVAVPFVFADPGVRLQKLKPTKLEGRKYELVKASFAPGIGDAPDDYYIVYINAKTKRVGAVRYVVSYKGFFPKGGHTPEKLMTYDGSQTIQGIHLPKTFRTFKWNKKRKRRGKLVTRTKLTEVSFQPGLKSNAFDVPKGAEILKGWKQ